MIAGILLGIVSGLLANECCELSPWCARKLVRWSAFRRYTDPGRAEMRAEELTALINDRPGNLLKLITAVGFAAVAVIGAARRAVALGQKAEARSRLKEVMRQIELREWDLWNHEDDLGFTTKPEAVRAINAERQRIRGELNALYEVKRQTESLLGSRG